MGPGFTGTHPVSFYYSPANISPMSLPSIAHGGSFCHCVVPEIASSTLPAKSKGPFLRIFIFVLFNFFR